MNLFQTLLRVIGIFCAAAPEQSHDSLAKMADEYQQQLCSRTFEYEFTEGRRKKTARIRFEPSGFCHLFSIGSIAKNTGADPDEYAGMRGWKNIQNGKITFGSLKRMNPEQFDYYHPEHLMFNELVKTMENPSAVRFNRTKLENSRLEAEILLYRTFGDKTVHVGIDQERDGDWFVRSYFVRDNSSKEYPTKYIARMEPLRIKTTIKR